MVDVLLARLNGLGIVLEIVVAIRQAEPSLIDRGNDLRRVVQVRGGAKGEQRPHSAAAPAAAGGPVQTGDFVDQLRLRIYLRNSIQLRLDRRESFGLNARFIHTGSVVIAVLLLEGAAFGVGVGGLLQNLMEDLAVSLCQLVEATPAGLIRGDGVVLHPISAGELIEVDAGLGGSIQGGDVE